MGILLPILLLLMWNNLVQSELPDTLASCHAGPCCRTCQQMCHEPICASNCENVCCKNSTVVQCCLTIKPCLGDSCQLYHRVCGDECIKNGLFHFIRFIPENPCKEGCMKKPKILISYTVFGVCHNVNFNCSVCSDDFYKNYYTYMRCRDCFYHESDSVTSTTDGTGSVEPE